jgi:seryl-tRNA synthetase
LIDPNLLVDDTDFVVRQVARKGYKSDLIFAARDAILRRRQLVAALDSMRAEMNMKSKEVGRLLAQGDQKGEEMREALAALKQDIAKHEGDVREADQVMRDLLLTIPNLPDADCPDGLEESDNVVVRYEGPPGEREPGRAYRPHWETAADLGIFDPERAAKLSGSGFSLLYGDGARLLRGLAIWGLDLNRDKYLEVLPAHFVRGPVMVGTGHLPKFADDAYSMSQDDLWAIPTGEVPLTALHRDEILDTDVLPKLYMAYTSCFRREAGAAGKDTRGMQRLHEFHKVELVRLCTKEQVQDQFAELLADAERTLQLLRLPYRVVDLACGDLTFSSARIFDLEVYAPGVDRWLEVSSVGKFTDFQGRRSNMRYRGKDGRITPVSTLNGSAVATPRLWAAIVEHGERPDGTVTVPEVLVPYVGKEVLTGRG